MRLLSVPMTVLSILFTMRTVAFFLAVFLVAGCEDYGIETLPDIPVAQLLQAPDTVSVVGKHLFLATEIWRDFMPISLPDGRPLVALVYLITADSSQFPASVSADAIWIVYNNQAWMSYLSDEPIPSDLERPYRLVRIAREGPKWGPGVRVDVVVRVSGSNGNSQLLRAPGQWIGMTE